MTISLNAKAIFDEIFALSALLAVSNPEVKRPALLCRDQIPGLRHLMRMAFANLVMQFSERVRSCRFDDAAPHDRPYDPDIDITLLIDFDLEDENPDNGRLLAVKASMEHVLALTTLSFTFDCVNPELARTYRAQAREATERLGDDIDPVVPPGRIAAWYY